MYIKNNEMSAIHRPTQPIKMTFLNCVSYSIIMNNTSKQIMFVSIQNLFSYFHSNTSLRPVWKNRKSHTLLDHVRDCSANMRSLNFGWWWCGTVVSRKNYGYFQLNVDIQHIIIQWFKDVTMENTFNKMFKNILKPTYERQTNCRSEVTTFLIKF